MTTLLDCLVATMHVEQSTGPIMLSQVCERQFEPDTDLSTSESGT